MYEKRILDNRLTCYFIKKQSKKCIISIAIKVGSTNEFNDNKGIAHFLEHMLLWFLKYEKDSYGLFGIVEGEGYTDYSETVLRFTTCNNKRDILKAIKTVSLILSGDIINDEWLEDVRDDIVNEYEKYKEGNVRRDKILSLLLDGSDFENKIPIGDYKSIKSIDIEKITQFFYQQYKLEKISVSILMNEFDDILPEVVQILSEPCDSIVTPVKEEFTLKPFDEKKYIYEFSSDENEYHFELHSIVKNYPNVERDNMLFIITDDFFCFIFNKYFTSVVKNKKIIVEINRRRFFINHYVYSIVATIPICSFDDYLYIVKKIVFTGLSHISDKYLNQCINDYLYTINKSIENEIIKNDNEWYVDETIINFLHDEPILSLEEEKMLITKVVNDLKLNDLINHFNKIVNGQNVCLYITMPDKLRTKIESIQNIF